LFLVLRIEKFLSKNSSDFYINVTNKNASKAHKSALTSNQSTFYQPFVWSAKRLDLKNTNSSFDLVFDAFYKQEINKLSDDSIINLINNNFIGCTIISGRLEARINEFDSNSTRESVLNSSYLPVFETINTEIRPHIYIESLELSPKPNREFVHLLYIYPQMLKFDSQRVFSKARNISVTIELRDNDRSDAKPLPIIFNTHYCPLFVTHLSSAITRHNVTPEFYQEIKVALPLNINLAKFHILFTFHHISCKDFSKVLIGYSWLSLEKQIHCDNGINLSIFGSLPNGYLSCQSLGLGKGIIKELFSHYL
jgi:dedicator of cytokinesis protein 9/10/11